MNTSGTHSLAPTISLPTSQDYPGPSSTVTYSAFRSVARSRKTACFIFNAATPLDWNTYTAKFDYAIDGNGKHTIFWRGNLQNDRYANGIPQFPGDPPSSVFLNNSKGYAIAYTGILRANLISN